jgi:FAD/FMN-containing dehydrogenase
MQFQSLIDCALNEGGCYYLTYHRWARPDQVERAYPEFREFLELKNQYDPHGVFTSEWHRHYRQMFGRR